jgi:hypothetical protein
MTEREQTARETIATVEIASACGGPMLVGRACADRILAALHSAGFRIVRAEDVSISREDADDALNDADIIRRNLSYAWSDPDLDKLTSRLSRLRAAIAASQDGK